MDVPPEDPVEAAGEQDDDDAENSGQAPLSGWQTLKDVAGGLTALVAVAVGVLALYVAGGVLAGFLAWAAPAVIALAAALLLGRYLSQKN